MTTSDGGFRSCRITALPSPEYYARPALGAATDSGVHAALAGAFDNTRTDRVVQVRAFARGVALNTRTGYEVLSNGTFVTTDGARTLQVIAGTSTVTRFRLVSAAGDSIDYARVQTWTLTASELWAFAGAYRSSEADTEWRIEADGTSLLVIRRAGSVM